MNNKGFTLAEVAVTLSILAIMAAIAVPSFISYLPKHRLQASARQIYDDLNLAKMEAVKRNADVFVKFYPATEKYTVYLDSDNSGTLNAGDTALKSNVTLENRVNMSGTNFTNATIGFNNSGMISDAANAGCYVEVTNPTGIRMRIQVIITGYIYIETSKDGGATWS